ncbi:dockerin type I domain-containing protein [Planctomycetaceae bacterium SH139]
MSKKRLSRRKLSSRQFLLRHCALEKLESRWVFDSEGLDIFGAGSFTMSVASDGTQVGFRQSKLHEVFQPRFGDGVVEQVLREAIQVWVPHASIDVGIVPDDGTPAGTLGPWRGDERFGDIRVFGFDLPDSIWASAISGDMRAVGTWAGDIVFNTAQEWSSVQELRSAAIHELGHALGLTHNDDPLSPMHPQGPFVSTDPLATDIALLQALHGARRADISDTERANDQIDKASDIEGHDLDEGSVEDFNGTQQWIQFGDLTTSEDIDYYEVEVAEDYDGAVGFAIQTSGFSVAELDVQLVDRDGNILASGIVDSTQDWLLVQPEQGDFREEYFLRISATASGQQSIGTYAIFVGLPEQLQSSQDDIVPWALRAFQWYQSNEQTEDGFSYHLRDSFFSGLGDDDGHQDDDGVGAVPLPLVVESELRLKYATVGTISSLDDIDSFRLDLPDELPVAGSLTVDIQSLDYRGLVPSVRILDHRGRDAGARVVASGSGLTQLLLDNPQPDDRYLLFLSGADVAAEFREGNFSLTVEVRKVDIPVRELVDVVLHEEQPVNERTFYVAETQLASFHLAAETVLPDAELSPSTSVVLRIFDESHTLWNSTAVKIGELRTLPGLLMEAGTYFIQLTLVANATALPDVAVSLDALFPSRPVGPLIASLDDEPLFECEVGGDFCFPDGTQTGQTTVVGIDVPPPLPDPPTLPPLLLPDGGFWLNTLLPTNPLNPQDVNGDLIVSPLDALIVINYLNRNGSVSYPNNFSGYLDVNGDRTVTAIDALRVINWLNRNP